MKVLVGVGTYQISGVTYNCVAQEVTIGAPPSTGYYRIDLIQIGIDGTADCKAGTPATSDPVTPTPDTGHVALGTVLVPYAATSIPSYYINVDWNAPAVQALVMIITDDDLAWTEASTNVRVQVLDQYGNGIITTTPGWYLQLEIMSGNGTISSAEEGSSRTIIGGHTGSNSYYDFTYTRDQLSTDEGVSLRGKLAVPLEQVFASITVRDADGNAMGRDYTDSGVVEVYDTIQDEGVNLVQRKKINFVGSGVTSEDDAGNEVTKVMIPSAPITLTPSATVTVDWSIGSFQEIVLSDDTVFTFSGGIDGDKLVLRIKQNDSVAKTVTLPGDVRFGTDITAYVVTATLEKQDYLGFIYDGAASKYDLVSVVKGY
jgi:hypothetical protein